MLDASFVGMKRLLPGYVFLDSEADPDWQPILRISDVYRRLAYQDGEYALRSGGLAFVEWLKRYNGVLEVSTAVQVGTRLQFIQGHLKDMAGRSSRSTRSAVQVECPI